MSEPARPRSDPQRLATERKPPRQLASPAAEEVSRLRLPDMRWRRAVGQSGSYGPDAETSLIGGHPDHGAPLRDPRGLAHQIPTLDRR